MAEGNGTTNNIRFISGLTLLIIIFWGDPDIHDAIIYWLMRG